MKKPKRLICHRCTRSKPGKYYLLYKEGYGWICPECGYTKLIPDGETDILDSKKLKASKKLAQKKISKTEVLSEMIKDSSWKEQL